MKDPKHQKTITTLKSQPDVSSERTLECVGGVDSSCRSLVSYLSADSNQRGGARRNVPLNPLYPKVPWAPEQVPEQLLSLSLSHLQSCFTG